MGHQTWVTKASILSRKSNVDTAKPWADDFFGIGKIQQLILV